MFWAVVTARGDEAVPVEKPFLDTTGPVKVVVAMMVPYMQVCGGACLHVVCPGSLAPQKAGIIKVIPRYLRCQVACWTSSHFLLE